MSKLYQTDSGYVALSKGGREVELCFNNFRLSLNMRSLRQLKNHLQERDPSLGMFTPEEKKFEVCFSSCRISLMFDYFEVQEFEELIEEGLAAWELYLMLNKAGIELPRDLIS